MQSSVHVLRTLSIIGVVGVVHAALDFRFLMQKHYALDDLFKVQAMAERRHSQ